jgi:hypothetical protein
MQHRSSSTALALRLAAFRIKATPPLFNEIAPLAAERVMAHFNAHRPNERPTVRFVSVVIAALALTGCNANQEVNLSSRAAPGVVAGPGYNPYDPISYAQNNTGNRSAR